MMQGQKGQRWHALAIAQGLAGLMALASTPAARAADACQVLTDAAVRQVETPHHGFMAVTIAGKTRDSEFISLKDTRYLKVNGKWQSHPRDAAKESAETAAAMRERKQTCSAAGSDTVDGEAATLYQVHSDDAGTDSRVWVSAAGLILRQDISDGGASTTRIRYDYRNVAAP